MATSSYDAVPIRLPLVADLHIDAFSGSTLTRLSSYMQNAVVEKYTQGTDERVYITQRPSFEILEDASESVSDSRGRGIYYWSTTNKVYFINNDTVYVGSYTNSIKTISAGTEKCYFFEVGSNLVFLDPENNEGWYINSSDAVTEITDADFPSTLAHGGAELDGFLFIMDEDGTIWHSDFEDATSWDALNFIDASKENDGGVYLTKLDNHIVAFGSRSTEFFYNAGNPTGSVINRRPDVYFNIGCGQPLSVVENGVDLKFLGKTKQGALSVYQLQNFSLKKISTSTIDAFITDSVSQADIKILAGGMYSQGHNFYLMSFYTTPSDIQNSLTLVYDSYSQIWGVWNTTLSEWSAFSGLPLIMWSISTTDFDQFGYGMMINGDRITIRTNFSPTDAFSSQYYIEDQNDYVVTDYVEVFGGTGTPIELITRIGQKDHDVNNNKFTRSLEWVGDYTENSQTLTVKWSDEADDDFNAGKSLDLSDRRKLTRLGKSNRRTYQLEYSGDEIIRGEAIELKVHGGEV